jgi:hypothetical protein
MGRGLDGLISRSLASCAVLRDRRMRPAPAIHAIGVRSRQFPVAIAWGKHLFPFRTEQLSPTAPMVLGPHGPGRVGRRRFFIREPPMGRLVVVKPGSAGRPPSARRAESGRQAVGASGGKASSGRRRSRPLPLSGCRRVRPEGLVSLRLGPMVLDPHGRHEERRLLIGVVPNGARRGGRDQGRVQRTQRRDVVAELHDDLAGQDEVDLLDRAMAMSASRVTAGRHVGRVWREDANVESELLRTERPRVAEECARSVTREIGRLGGAEDPVVAHAPERSSARRLRR